MTRKLLNAFLLVVMAVLFLPIFLFAAFLIFFAPVPQLIIHARWCWMELGLLGKLILLLSGTGIVAVVIGLVRKRVLMHRVGILLLVIPVIGIALHRVTVLGNWRELSLLVAFLLTVTILYFTAALDDSHEASKTRSLTGS